MSRSRTNGEENPRGDKGNIPIVCLETRLVLETVDGEAPRVELVTIVV